MRNDDIIMSQKPYLIRAIYEWMLDYSYTPKLVICPLVANVIIPHYLSNQSQITLDISPRAITGLILGNENVTFEAYFDKTPYKIVLPMNCIGAIIAKEKEVGYVFDIDDFIPQQAIRDLKQTTENNTSASVQNSLSKKAAEQHNKVKSTKQAKQKLTSLSLQKKSVSKLNKTKKYEYRKKNKKSNLLSSLRNKIKV